MDTFFDVFKQIDQIIYNFMLGVEIHQLLVCISFIYILFRCFKIQNKNEIILQIRNMVIVYSIYIKKNSISLNIIGLIIQFIVHFINWRCNKYKKIDEITTEQYELDEIGPEQYMKNLKKEKVN